MSENVKAWGIIIVIAIVVIGILIIPGHPVSARIKEETRKLAEKAGISGKI